MDLVDEDGYKKFDGIFWGKQRMFQQAESEGER
jgi:hypothetical protein